MKPLLFFILMMAGVPAFAGWESPIQKVEREIKEMDAARAKFERKRENETVPEIREEFALIQKNFIAQQINLHANLKELRSRTDTRRPCPICGGKLVPLGSLHDDHSKPAINSEAWDRRTCSFNYSFFSASPICKKCWFAQDIVDGSWVRASVDRDSFFHPLESRIRNFPLPDHQTSSATYRQTFEHGGYSEDVVFYSAKDEAYFNRAKDFARENKLYLETTETTNFGTRFCAMTKAPEKILDGSVPGLPPAVSE